MFLFNMINILLTRSWLCIIADCLDAIKTAHKELDKHRGWTEILGNLAIFIFGFGFGFIAKGFYNMANDKPFLFFTKTSSAEMLDDTEKSVADVIIQNFRNF